MTPFDAFAQAVGSHPVVLPLLPTILITQHAAYLYWSKPFDDELKFDGKRLEQFAATRAQATDQYRGAFGLAALSVRYLLPAFIVGLVTLTVTGLAFGDLSAMPAPGVSRAAMLGALGAYFSVLLYLGRRSLRHDLTSGGATLCAITLVLGPLLAAVIALVGSGSTGAEHGALWAPDAIYFVAGVAPRRIAAALVEAVAKLWAPENGKAPPPTRVIPLGQVRGITPDIEERLSEEGVYDVITLAMADPFLLLRNTSFDLRQILNWMDEALLIMFLPESWLALEKEGITGAVDLAWYYDPDKASDSGLTELAVRAEMKVPTLREAAVRLGEDAQVRLVWFLYQAGSDDVGRAGDANVPPSETPSGSGER